MTILDTSAVISHLTGADAGQTAQHLASGLAAAPDVVVFEVLSVLRRSERRGQLEPERARAAVEDLADLALELFPSLGLRRRAWAMRHNLTAADALFVALAEDLGEPLLTGDRRLAEAARAHAGIETIVLGE